MSKKKQNRSKKRQNDLPQMPPMWEDFKARGLAATDKDPKEIIRFIAERNAHTILLLGAGTERQQDNIADEAAIFFVRFSALFGNNRRLIKQIEENWPQKPLIFRVAAEVLEHKSWRPISEKLAKNVLIMSDYILQMREDRYLSTSQMTMSSGDQLFFPRTIPHGDLRSVEVCIIGAILDEGLEKQGSIVFRHGDDSKEEYIIEGVLCRNGDFFGLPADSMKAVSEMMPDGTTKADPTATYRMPPVIFQPPKG